jgi:hypothetical protein
VIYCCCCCGIHLLWMYHYLLKPLDAIANEMAHLDPTVIRNLEVPMDTLKWYFSTTILAHAIFHYTRSPCWRKQMYSYAHWIQGSCVTYLLLLLSGINPLKTSFHTTMISSLYIVILSLGSETSSQSWSMFPRLKSLLKGSEDIVASSSFYGVFCGAIPFQLLQVLDWGLQIQRWPLPLIIGTTIGWVVGTMVGIIILIGFIQDPYLGNSHNRE